MSTSDQTCAQQLQELRSYALARGWVVQGEYVDEAVSGKRDSRPALDRLMKAARRRSLDAVACWKLDRWGRSMPHFVQSVRELDSLGVRFAVITQGIDTDQSNPTSRLMLNMLAAFAELERELIVERTMAGLARARAAGKRGGRPRKVVNRSKVQALAANGDSLATIAKAVGVSKSSVHRILRAQ